MTGTLQWLLNFDYRKNLRISHTFLLKFWAQNRGCGLCTRPLLSKGERSWCPDFPLYITACLLTKQN